MASTTFSNAPTSLGLQNYRSVVNKYGGPAKAHRFFVRFASFPIGLMSRGTFYNNNVVRDLGYLCEAAEFPGRGFMNTDLRYYGPSFKAPFQSTYEDLNLTFVVRDSFLERQFFDDWINIINPINTYDFQYRKNYISQIELFQMSEKENYGESDKPNEVPPGSRESTAQYKFTFEEAWPILINPMPTNWAEDNFHRLTVSFTYTRWYRQNLDTITAPTYSLVNGAVVTTDGNQTPYFNVR